jgi:hypothetical protein
MNWPPRNLKLFTAIWLIAAASNVSGPQDVRSSELVEITGLNAKYGSCSLVNIKIRNVSQQPIYLKVYPEDFLSGSWNETSCPYDLVHPKSEYYKLVIRNPELMKPGAFFLLSYDRCSAYERCVRGVFSAKDKRATRQGPTERDAEAASPLSQRLRVEVYVADRESVKLVDKRWSKTFLRVPSNGATSLKP